MLTSSSSSLQPPLSPQIITPHSSPPFSTDVLVVEPDLPVQSQFIPNDRRWSLQWGPIRVKAPAAWDKTTGPPSATPGPTVCVIDSGVDYTHQDLKDNIHPLIGWNTITQSNDPMDDSGHGTHVSGIIGAIGNNNLGVAGMIWNTKILACKFLNEKGIGSISGIIECLDFCLRNNATISNNSYGLYGLDRRSSVLKTAIDNATKKGHLFVTAAGNKGINNDYDLSPVFPAAFNVPGSITVAAIDQQDNLASFSCYGQSSVHIAAPGNDILSTYPGNWLAYLSGTSMAAPMVAGTAALLKSRAGSKLTNAQIRDIILSSAAPLAALRPKIKGGLLNVNAAMNAVDRALVKLATLPSPPPPPSNSLSVAPKPVKKRRKRPFLFKKRKPPAPKTPASKPTTTTTKKPTIPKFGKAIKELIRAKVTVAGSSCQDFIDNGKKSFVQTAKKLARTPVSDIKVSCSVGLKGKQNSRLTITMAIDANRPIIAGANIKKAIGSGSFASALKKKLRNRFRVIQKSNKRGHNNKVGGLSSSKNTADVKLFSHTLSKRRRWINSKRK
jgi:hypothetical protein